MRIFYAAYLLDEPFATLINSIRLLCEPLEKHLAHVTIRGPYDNLLPPDEVENINRNVNGKHIRVLGGTFFGPSQATVYLACSASELPFVWHKPDFDYHPHITLYDGPSLQISRELRMMLLHHEIAFDFTIEALYPLTTTPGQQDLTLRASIPESFIDAFFAPLGRSLNDALKLPEYVRLLLVDELLRVLSEYHAHGRAQSAEIAARPTFDFADLLGPPRVSSLRVLNALR